ncbi:hypothetical protein GCM10010156_49250 [Planobispora rosea]|uniref:Uncharacterized protein n=1 Tax=Planobispora rosea TaxID=35762 RepID=A0A8J3S5P6_PLARO|nr:hypothetical protein [Planobispora rosea]GGS84764.1 hypothetical protein GCM10010156_49250 [Planobispora rosea]GIH86436.1 hypothetical protein Pro02_48440 [Planobispora rosea]
MPCCTTISPFPPPEITLAIAAQYLGDLNDSIAIVGFGPDQQLTAVISAALPEYSPDLPGQLQRLTKDLKALGIDSTAVIGYGAAEYVTPALSRLPDMLADTGIETDQILHYADGCYSSLGCIWGCCTEVPWQRDQEQAAAAAIVPAAGLAIGALRR